MFGTTCAAPPPGTAAAPAAPGDENLALIARQPIVDEDRVVHAYELFDRSTAAHAHSAASDAALLLNALSCAGSPALLGKQTVFINCTHESLSGGHLELIHPEKVVLEVPPLHAGATAQQIAARVPLLQALCSSGFRLALDQQALDGAYTGWLALAAFIKLDMQAFASDRARALVAFARGHSQATLVAEKVETGAQFGLMRTLGVTLFQGYLLARPMQVQVTTLRPARAAVLALIGLLRAQAGIGQIEDLLKRDPVLAFNLLRFIESSGFGLSCEVGSLRHAVRILGAKKLYRWATLLADNAGSATLALAPAALARARLMELLAADLLTPEQGDAAFLVGLFSLLDQMLALPMETVLESVALPEAVAQALLHGSGVFAPLLELARACESGDQAQFARAAQVLQLSGRQINLAHLQALDWAAQAGPAAASAAPAQAHAGGQH